VSEDRPEPAPLSEKWAAMPAESTSARLRHVQEALAASQQDLTATRGQVVDLLYILDAFQIESGADRNAALQTGIDAVRQTRAELEQLRTAAAAVLAELRELAGDARSEAAPFRHTSSPLGFGPHRAAEAYEKAVALVETLDGESRG
jgi:septal ring factor EnvC (AmiA/AmiB activator)